MADRTTLPHLSIVYGSQTGNAELIAMDALDAAKAHGFAADLLGMDEIDTSRLAALRHVLVISSTYDDGDMPDNAQELWDELESDAPDLSDMTFAVLAIGDSSYDDFCGAGRRFDEKLAELGARRLLGRTDCDLDYARPAAAWTSTALTAFARPDSVPAATAAPVTQMHVADGWTRRRPFRATLRSSRPVSGGAARKRAWEYEIDLTGSGIDYAPGDSLGVVPRNEAALVDQVLEALGVAGDTPWTGNATWPAGGTWHDHLTADVELRLPSRELITWAATHDDQLARLAEDGRESLADWLHGRDVLDILETVPAGQRTTAVVADLLRPLQHRSYSILSSPTESPNRVQLLVATVDYTHGGRRHRGACSAHLTYGHDGSEIAVFAAPSPGFRLPDADTPLIMIGPGVGVAPFLSFLREREATSARGESWLLTGGQHEEHDFLYRETFEDMLERGALSRLDTAFSRDQNERVYVQDRMRENGKELWSWLERGAAVYVCGDASRMAPDVEQALTEIIREHGGLTDTAAARYVEDLKRQRRYSRDVY